MRKLLSATILLLTAGVAALANDSTAQLATGGLVFVKNDSIEMRAEDLYISTAEVRVRYRFFNRTERDVTVHVAFPMPEVRLEDHDIAIPSDDPVNLLDFTTRADGRPVAAQVEQRVFAGGVDRTELLRGLGVPMAPHLRAAAQALDRLPKARQDELVRLGLAEVEEFDAGKGMERHLAPRWSLRTTFYWQQTFPAGRETLIEHRYRPSVGMSVGTGIGVPGAAGETWYAEMVRKYCIEKSIINALDRARRAARVEAPPFTEERIEYVLATGANWAGSIRDFRVVIDKGDPDALVTFCGDGVKKIGPTRFEMRRTNFTPEGNLAVLIFRRQRNR